MKTITMICALGFAAMAGGCSDDNSSSDMGTDMAASPFPSAPTIGATQLDRMGRAGVNTALTDPFFTAAQKDAHEMKLDDFNKRAQASWPMDKDKFTFALGILDGLDGICGNQPLASVAGVDGGAASAYSALADILLNDQLLLATAVTTCDPAKNYLAVEVSVITGAATPASCGGRTPLDSAINVTYAVLSGGLISSVAVVDGLTGEADPVANRASLTAFPYLGAPL